MRTFKSIASLFLFLTILISGCTRNDGDIGPLFGKWKVENITCSELENIPDYEGNIFISFQNSVVFVQTVLPMHEYIECYGNFIRKDNFLTLSFPDEAYIVPETLMIPRTATLKIISLSGKRMTLEYHPSESITITYNLKKW